MKPILIILLFNSRSFFKIRRIIKEGPTIDFEPVIEIHTEKFDNLYKKRKLEILDTLQK